MNPTLEQSNRVQQVSMVAYGIAGALWLFLSPKWVIRAKSCIPYHFAAGRKVVIFDEGHRATRSCQLTLSLASKDSGSPIASRSFVDSSSSVVR